MAASNHAAIDKIFFTMTTLRRLKSSKSVFDDKALFNTEPLGANPKEVQFEDGNDNDDIQSFEQSQAETEEDNDDVSSDASINDSTVDSDSALVLRHRGNEPLGERIAHHFKWQLPSLNSNFAIMGFCFVCGTLDFPACEKSMCKTFGHIQKHFQTTLESPWHWQ